MHWSTIVHMGVDFCVGSGLDLIIPCTSKKNEKEIIILLIIFNTCSEIQCLKSSEILIRIFSFLTQRPIHKMHMRFVVGWIYSAMSHRSSVSMLWSK